ncbi:MAG: riboflavin synthase [Elusimicrobia bacterium]|nr:riboflavin synthase [Elusimicrobiota bacterium]
MFTGIIEKTGKIAKRGRMEIFVDSLEGVETGESVAVNGVCLTAAEIDGNLVRFDVTSRTMEITNLGFSEVVNIERALKVGDAISGHFLTGHIDGLLKIERIENLGDFKKFFFSFPALFSKFIAARGSVGIDGISLTVEKVEGNIFSVNLIPETLGRTNLSFRRAGDFVNFEADVFARYIVNFLERKEDGITKEKLEKWL